MGNGRGEAISHVTSLTAQSWFDGPTTVTGFVKEVIMRNNACYRVVSFDLVLVIKIQRA